MLVKAIRGDKWPNSKLETFQLACEKLVDEANKRHRDQKRDNPISKEQLLDSAGQLFAAMLLADKDGIALDQDQATRRFPYLGYGAHFHEKFTERLLTGNTYFFKDFILYLDFHR